MAELSSLILQLRERISASSSAASSSSQAANNGVDDDDDQLENRFHSVLPNLLFQTYLLPSSTVLKLLSLKLHNIIKNCPAICRVLPFFDEPEFRRASFPHTKRAISGMSRLRRCFTSKVSPE
ncbi:serine/threonine-protein kinase ATR-like [Papaver somniferum]|uniref:serine/threonine-protein kinase ATR-like n=1 Tax=Papaver somniferum TaxID=3469 RepID=UPI000E6FC8CB|nr:serine/threonine-protein kinase ATR-like [Papaver somniferum]